MADENDGGIVKGYLDQFLQLSVKSYQGEDVWDRVVDLVDEAFAQMDVWTTGTPAANKAKLIGKLKMSATLMAPTSPEQAKVLMDAAELASAK